MLMRQRPPGRKSRSTLVQVNPSGPHQRIMWSRSSQRRQTSATGASKVRVISSSSSRTALGLALPAIGVSLGDVLKVSVHLVEAPLPEPPIAIEPAIDGLQ